MIYKDKKGLQQYTYTTYCSCKDSLIIFDAEAADVFEKAERGQRSHFTGWLTEPFCSLSVCSVNFMEEPPFTPLTVTSVQKAPD